MHVQTQTALGLVLAAVIGAITTPACSSIDLTCERLHSCESRGGNSGASGSEGGDSGTAGGSAASGGSGKSGASNAGSSGTSGTSGTTGDAGAAGTVSPPCDTTKSPSEETCLVSDEFAIFVAPTGKDGSGGTKAGPVKTIAKAIELAGDTKMVIACDGSYAEQVKLTAGAKLYGGFACPGSAMPWKYETGKKSKVAPSDRGVALGVATGAAVVVIEDFEFDALDATDPGESSVAAFVNTSTAVAFTRVKLVAGKGMDGANGTMTPATFPLPSMLKGNSASGDTGGAFNLITCPAGGATKGGKGGDGGLGITGGQNGTPDLGGGKGGTVGSCGMGGLGGDGGDAPPQPAASGATKVGSITPAGWTGAAGTDGAPGTPGQGGGGGTGAESNSTTGAVSGGAGGGGAGGCGGAPGTAGKAGGSSIALLVLSSAVTLSASELVTGDAGKGGDGAAGQDGQTQSGGGGVQSGDACQGGKGGKGGKGGAGGGAAGGVSLGIAYQGMAPTTDADTKSTTGAAGAKGIGGAPGINDGIAGIKQDVLEVP